MQSRICLAPHRSRLWLSIVQAVYFVVMSAKWQVKEAQGARHQIGSHSERRSVKLDVINTPLWADSVNLTEMTEMQISWKESHFIYKNSD